MPGMQPCEKPRGVNHIGMGVEHGADGFELGAMIAVIDLHAAKVNQGLSLGPGPFKLTQSLAAVLLAKTVRPSILSA
jgi:hypothetical protein